MRVAVGGRTVIFRASRRPIAESSKFMSQPVRISLDAMGGDKGPSVVVPGAALALERHPDMRFLLFGNEHVISPLVEANPKLKNVVEIRHTEVAIGMDDKPSQ